MSIAEPLELLAARLAARVLDVPELALGDDLELRAEGLPDWWLAGGNRLWTRPGADLPALGIAPGSSAPTGALVVLASDVAPAFLLWGAAPLVVMGRGTRLPNGWLCCGDGATVAIGAGTGSVWSARIDARNGGVVSIGADGLWATGVVVQSDDMHAIRDREGRRVNAFGGVIAIDRHVWLAHEALVLGGARIGADTVVGARAVVTGTLPANTVCVGTPARPVRTDVSWAFEDRP